MVIRNLRPVCPNPNRCAGRVAVGFELIFSFFPPWLLQLDDDVGGGWVVVIEDHNVGELRLCAKLDRKLNGDSILGIAIGFDQATKIQLPDYFFRFQSDVFISLQTSRIKESVAIALPGCNATRQRRNLGIRE